LPNQPFRSRRSTVLLCLATVTASAALAPPVFAQPQRVIARLADAAGRAEERAGREQERIARAEERAAQRRERQAQRAQRQAQRAEERAARAEQRASGRGTSHAVERPVEATPPTGEAGAGSGPSRRSATALGGCRISLQASSNQITAGETVGLLGSVACPTAAADTAAAATPITVEQRALGAGPSSFVAVGTATANADGTYEFSPPPIDSNAIFRVRFGRRGAHTTVRVAPTITLDSPTAVAQASTVHGQARASRRATFTGTVSPAKPGAVVVLQVAYSSDGEQWRSVAIGHVGADGSYSIAHGFRTPGELTIRTVVHPGRLNTPAASEPIGYEVSQPQNPQLTLQTSADPISSGQTATLSGIAAGAVNQPVTLLARTGHGAFAAIAQTTTDSAGNYSFTQAPSANTSYRVSDATDTSTTLFEGVRYALTLASMPTEWQTGQQVTFAGTVAPSAAGKVVYLQRRNSSGIGFHDVASATVAADLSYAIARTFYHPGAQVMRVRVPAGVENQATASEPVTLQIAAAPAAPEPAAGAPESSSQPPA
jgi:hypothetical protein